MSVLIVGAGPTGLTLACELARRDLPVRIVDKAAEYFVGSRGKGLQPRTLEVLDDLDVVDEAFAWGIEGITIRNYVSGRPPEDVEPQSTAVRTPSVPYPKGMIIPQWRTERILRDRLADFGVRVELSTEVVEFEQSGEHVTATLNGPAGVERIEVDYLVGCDGGRSGVRKALGLDFAGETAETAGMIIADLEVTGLADDRWHMWMGRGFLALCPFPGASTWQLQAVFPPDENGGQPEPSLETFRRAVTELSGMTGIEVANPTWQSTYRVNERMVDRMRVGRVFVAGDAAHVHSPAGGLGLNTGIQDAYNLGWKLAAVLRGQADDTLLDSYQEERLPIAAWTLNTSGERLRNMAESAGRGENAFTAPTGWDENRQLGLGYRWSGLSRELVDREGLLRAGDRAPDAPCTNRAGATVRLFDLFRGPQFTLLGFGAGCAEAVREVALARPGLVGAHLIAPDADVADVVDGTGDAADAYGITRDTLVLVRPDGYVAVIAGPDDVAAVLDHPGWNRVRQPAAS